MPVTLPAESDESLMRAFAAGDESAFRALFRRHAAATLAFLQASTSNREAAEDLLQETFSRVCRNCDDWREGRRGGEGDSFRAWLFAIARNLARDAGRRATVRRRLTEEPEKVLDAAPPPESPHDATERGELAARVMEAVAALPEAQRDAFVMVRLQELTYEEVAAACATTVAAAKMRVARATAALAGILGGKLDLPGDDSP